MTEHFSRPTLALMAMLLAQLHAAPANAETIDVSNARCSDFIAMNSNDRDQLALWLAGYFAGGAGRPMLDIARITVAPAELLALCTKTPQAQMIGAEARAVFMPPTAP